jgi:hypothetical protein
MPAEYIAVKSDKACHTGLFRGRFLTKDGGIPKL